MYEVPQQFSSLRDADLIVNIQYFAIVALDRAVLLPQSRVRTNRNGTVPCVFCSRIFPLQSGLVLPPQSRARGAVRVL